MLEQLLRAEKCAACKWCCKFNESDFSERPQIFADTVTYIKERFPGQKLVEGKCDEWYFDMPRTYCVADQEEQYTCPMLRDGDGCALGEMRMLDCKIWPFRIMDCPKGLAITLSDQCGCVNARTDAEIMEELLDRGLAGVIFQAARLHPVMVKPYRKDHRIILYMKEYWDE